MNHLPRYLSVPDYDEPESFVVVDMQTKTLVGSDLTEEDAVKLSNELNAKGLN